MARFAIAGLQLQLTNKNNCYLIQKEIENAKLRFPWVDMFVVGELACFGPSVANAQPLPCEFEAFFCELARIHQVWILPGSVFEKDGDRIYNTAPVINPRGEVVTRYRKMFPFEPYEKGVSKGQDFVVFDVPDVGRFGVSICYDQWFPETTRTLACMGADVILHPTMTNTIDRDIELSISRASAAQNQCYFFSVNVAGDLGVGRSIVVGPGGEVVYQAGEVRDVFPVEIDLDYVRRVRQRGFHGLGQTLKSFRDCSLKFPPYEQGHHSSGFLQSLGALSVPGSPQDEFNV